MELKIPKVARRIGKRLGLGVLARYLRGEMTGDNAGYWTVHNVTNHQRFASAQASLDYFHWRNAQYHGYIDLMPVTGQDGQCVLDYGCGPGNDLVGFAAYSKPSRLIGMDISPASVAEARERAALHASNVEVMPIVENKPIPLEDASIDYLHSSGVVHHAADPAAVLREFRRVLKPTGRCRIMVYNYDSLWVHLLVAYIKIVRENAFPGMDVRSAFAKTTDGPYCPIARVYKPTEFIELARTCGFECRFLGAAVSLQETSLLQTRFDALQLASFPAEHRDFLLALEFDAKGYPMYHGTYAGVDGCYELTPAR
jgi:ubiquinone/menaquinone biosynthesis C-methylase UbiE